jgi:KDO2-lipid IV(A) lauroyltransferase
MFSLFLFNVVRRSVSAIPPGLGYFLARALAPFHYYCFPSRRAAVLSNVHHVLNNSPSQRFKEIGERNTAMLIFRSFNEFLYEFFKIPSLDRRKIEQSVTFEGLENLNAALSEGRGAVIATAHIGNWEFGGAALALMGYKLHVVAGVQFNGWFSEHVKDMKRRLDIGVVSPEEGYRALFRALRDNECVVLLVDGDVFVEGLNMELFSKPARIPSGAAALSLRTKAPVVPGYITREGPFSFKLRMDKPILPDPGTDKARDVERLTEEIMSRVEGYIEQNLDQWCIFRNVWPAASKQ